MVQIQKINSGPNFGKEVLVQTNKTRRAEENRLGLVNRQNPIKLHLYRMMLHNGNSNIY